MDKIKVSKEVANALEVALKTCSKAKFFEQHSNKMQWTLEVYLPLNQISNWEMAQILINGYEVEETPEEKILATFERQFIQVDAKDICDKRVRTAYANAILYTLDTLGIKIKGIND